MITLGYKLSSEEQSATDLVRYAQMAQDTGFGFALISGHFHPWIDRQGQSPFVWSVLGAIAQATQRLTVGTAVTCPSMRIHSAIIAQAAATTATLMPGAILPGRRHRGEPHRARDRARLAGDRSASGTSRRGHRDHPTPLEGR